MDLLSLAACTNCTGVPCSDGTTIGDDSSDKVAATSPFLSKSTAAQQQSFGDPQQKDFDPAAGRQLRRGKYPRELRHFFQGRLQTAARNSNSTSGR